MTKPDINQRLLDPGIIAIIRADSSEQLLEAAAALLAGGITAMEVTMTTPNALQVIADVRAGFGDAVLIGVGTVLDEETCRAAIDAGAEFIVTPMTKPAVIRAANELGKPIASGAFTPTEALLAHESGADFIKLFPADLAGPGYIRNLLAPPADAAHHPDGRHHRAKCERFSQGRQRRSWRRFRAGLGGYFAGPGLVRPTGAGRGNCARRPRAGITQRKAARLRCAVAPEITPAQTR